MREIGSALYAFMDKYLSWIDKPKIGPTDIIEIIIIAFVLYHVMVWVKNNDQCDRCNIYNFSRQPQDRVHLEQRCQQKEYQDHDNSFNSIHARVFFTHTIT